MATSEPQKAAVRKKNKTKKSNEAAHYGSSWKKIVFVEILEFSDLIDKLEQSSVAAEQEDLENLLFLELNIFQVSEFPPNFFSLNNCQMQFQVGFLQSFFLKVTFSS